MAIFLFFLSIAISHVDGETYRIDPELVRPELTLKDFGSNMPLKIVRCRMDCLWKRTAVQSAIIKCKDNIGGRGCKCMPSYGRGYRDLIPVASVKNCFLRLLYMAEWIRRVNYFNKEICGVSTDSLPLMYLSNPDIPTTPYPDDRSRRLKIKGGEKVNYYRFPWALKLLIYDNSDHTEYFKGSAVLIGKKHALTAAHVVQDIYFKKNHDVWAIGGGSNWTYNYEQRQWAKAKKVTFHPTYRRYVFPGEYGNNNCFYRYNKCIDLAVLELETEIANTMPICLPERNMKTGTEPLRLVGWGYTEAPDGLSWLLFGGGAPQMLHFVDLHIAHCSDKDNYICTKGSVSDPTEGAGCPGDSGSGLLCKDGSLQEGHCHKQEHGHGLRRFRLVGILRGNIEARKLRPGQYFGDDCSARYREASVNVMKFMNFICEYAAPACFAQGIYFGQDK